MHFHAPPNPPYTNDENKVTGTFTAPDGSTPLLWPTGLTDAQSLTRWRANLLTLVYRCQQAGIRPVIIMPGGTASESQMQHHVQWAQALEMPPVTEWVALAGELTDATAYINTVGKRTGTRVMVGTSPRYATGPLPADAWTVAT